ncbi:MAG TPA: hypothetical protein PK431_08780 [Chitinophagales bacterium]|nr:hypothetical protein [Chitinophagales bacterium]
MKNIFLFSLMIACLFSFGKCNKKKKCCKKKASTETSASKLNANEVWMQYDETKCENPWQFNWFQKPTQAQILGAIKSNLLGKEITALELRSSTEKDFISCEACNCPNGTHYFVRVNKSEIEKLKALKFYEIKNVPIDVVIDNTK